MARRGASGAGVAAAVPRSCRELRSSAPKFLERQADGKVHADALRILPVRDVDAKRADRRAQPPAHTVARCKMEMAERIGRIARIDKGCDSPVLSDPAGQFDARDGVIA